MKSLSFMPVVEEVSSGNVSRTPELEAVISYWTEGACAADEWFDEVNGYWGNAGFMMRRGEEVLGLVVYGPQECLPRAGQYPVEHLSSEDAALLAYIEGDQRARRHLLVRMLKDLRYREVRRVEAIASDLGLPHHASTSFLLENGWKPVEHCWQRGAPYTLARVEMGGVVEVGELARGLIGRVKLPALKRPHPVPGAFVRFARGERLGGQGGRITVLTAEAPSGVVARTSII